MRSVTQVFLFNISFIKKKSLFGPYTVSHFKVLPYNKRCESFHSYGYVLQAS